MIRLFHGDCLELFKDIEDQSIDLILCDPPYGTTQCKWDSVIPLDLLWDEIHRTIKTDSSVVMTASQPFTTILIQSNLENFKYCWVWEKNLKSGNLNARKMPMKGHEDIVVFGYGKATYNPQKRKRTTERKSGNRFNSKTSVYGKQKEIYVDRQGESINPDSIIRDIKCVHNSSGKLHPTQKPVPLMQYLIETYTNVGDTVLDFAMGSGTTGVACMNLKRNFIGFEKDKKYFDLSYQRILGDMFSDCF